jgi:hypothetical protein
MSAILGSSGAARREQQCLRLAQALLAAYRVNGHAAIRPCESAGGAMADVISSQNACCDSEHRTGLSRASLVNMLLVV